MSESTKELNHNRLMEFLAKSCCAVCGNTDLRVLTFDHLPGKKKTATVSSLVHKGYSWNVIMKEINKCQILCLNDHMIVTDMRANSKRQQFWEQQQSEGK